MYKLLKTYNDIILNEENKSSTEQKQSVQTEKIK